jgi:hypothetical protein
MCCVCTLYEFIMMNVLLMCDYNIEVMNMNIRICVILIKKDIRICVILIKKNIRLCYLIKKDIRFVLSNKED